MSQLINICAAAELTPGQRRLVDVRDDDEALVLNIDGAYYAISNVCPHAGAALERGDVMDGVLFCPLHQWGFRLADGRSIAGDHLCARTYRVITRGGHLYLACD